VTRSLTVAAANSDVDLHARKIRVVSPYVRGEFNDPNSEDSGRSVPLARRVADALVSLHGLTLYPADHDLVFCHPETGNPLDRSKLVRRFRNATECANVRSVTFHELRHTFGTRMAANGVALRTIQHWMGHADSKTTQVYAHYQPSDTEADTVDNAFAPTSPPSLVTVRQRASAGSVPVRTRTLERPNHMVNRAPPSDGLHSPRTTQITRSTYPSGWAFIAKAIILL
jgi:hypothetical protein